MRQGLLRKKDKERAEAIEQLKDLLKEGDTIYTILRSVSRSGLSRVMSVYVIKDNTPISLDYLVSKALGLKQTAQGVRIEGTGMDMGFALTYELSTLLFGVGYKLNHKWL